MRIASINFYVYNKNPRVDLRVIRLLRLDVIGWQEMHRHLHLLKEHLPAFDTFHGKANTKGSNEVSVSLRRKGKQLIKAGGREVSDVERGEETKVFKSRWITVVRWKEDGQKYAIVNYHGNAVLQNKRTGRLLNLERVREWVEGSIIIERTIKRLQKRGFRVFVTGDWNYRRMRVRGFELSYWSPQRIFERRRLAYVENGLDYVAYPQEMRRIEKTIVKKETHGGDHDWIVVEVV